MSPRSQSSPAIILATRPLGEADLLVVLLGAATGKVRAAARNARRSKRRFPSGLSGGALGDATIAQGRGSLLRLEAFRTTLDSSPLGRDLTRFAHVAYLCELTDALVHEPEPDPQLFEALREAVEATVVGPADPALLRRFELRLLGALGLLPALEHCCVCGTVLAASDTVGFDAERGGALCSDHRRGTDAGWRPAAGPNSVAAAEVPAALLELCSALVGAPDPVAARTVLGAADLPLRRAVRDLTTALVRRHLRRPLRSLEFFGKVHPGSGDSE